MNKNVAVIGGDARYLELITQLQRVTTSIIAVGFDTLAKGFVHATHIKFPALPVETMDVVILPITGVDSKGYVETVFSDQSIQLTKDWFQRLPSHALVITGMANAHLQQMAKDTNTSLVPLLDRNDVAIYNSIPTAEGALLMAMEHTDYTIHSSRIIVVGFGRVGDTVANKFSALGAHVSVCAKDVSDLARITERGYVSIPLEQLPQHTPTCDILINTVPAKVIQKDSMRFLPAHSMIIDLASHPGGTDFIYAKQRGIKAYLAKSLPGIVAPKTAGKILADVILHMLKD